MNTRIRYVKQPDGTKESMQVLKAADGSEYKVLLSADDKSAQIVAAASGTVLKSVGGTNPGATKIAAKKALKELGVEFGNETRTKAGSSLS